MLPKGAASKQAAASLLANSPLCHPPPATPSLACAPPSLQRYLAPIKPPPPQDHHIALGICYCRFLGGGC